MIRAFCPKCNYKLIEIDETDGGVIQVLECARCHIRFKIKLSILIEELPKKEKETTK